MTPWSTALLGSRGASTQDTVDGGANSSQRDQNKVDPHIKIEESLSPGQNRKGENFT